MAIETFDQITDYKIDCKNFWAYLMITFTACRSAASPGGVVHSNNVLNRLNYPTDRQDLKKYLCI